MNGQNISCVGFIMDGNRRWAQKNRKQSFEGHQAGYLAFKEIIRAVHRSGIPHMVSYAFSTENWNRSPLEVGLLMELMEKAFADLPTDSEGKKINYRIFGQIDRLPLKLQKEVAALHERNKPTAELTVWIALSYGSRAEITHAVNEAIEKGSPVTEASFGEFLWTDGMPDPDLIIRTSGESRLSNFLLWQSAYSELFFTDTLWPDFGEAEFQRIVEEYGKREKRRGT